MTKKIDYTYIYITLGVIALVIGIINISQLAATHNIVDQKKSEMKESARPADLEVFVLTDSSCDNCIDVNAIVESVKAGNTNIIKEENFDFQSTEAQKLIKSYNIKSVPSIVLTGEVNKFSSQGFEPRGGNALVFEPTTPPFTDIASGQVTGVVQATIISDSACKECRSMENFLAQLKQIGVFIEPESTIEQSSSEGRQLIEKYSLEKLPALILSQDFKSYGQQIEDLWLQIGTKEADGKYVLQQTNPPYKDITTGQIKGLVTMTVLLDEDCTSCYDTEKLNTPILERLGLVPAEINRLSITSEEGKALLSKYNITLVPTIILSDDVKDYAALAGVWKDVGTVESDGSYIFRKAGIFGQPYKDLSTGKIINPSITQDATASS